MNDTMTDSEDESLDISKTLFNTDLSLPSLSDPLVSKSIKKSTKKSENHESSDFLDIFSNKPLGTSRLNGSSFKNMGKRNKLNVTEP